MDERVKWVRNVDGSHAFRIHETDLADMGKAGLEAELSVRGFTADQLGKAKYDRHRMRWEIPVRSSE